MLCCSTLKRDCLAGIKLSLSEDGQHLIVTSICEDHNHDVTKYFTHKHTILTGCLAPMPVKHLFFC